MLLERNLAQEMRFHYWLEQIPQLKRLRTEAKIEGDLDRVAVIQEILDGYLGKAVRHLQSNGYSMARIAQETALTYYYVRKILVWNRARFGE